MSKLTKSSKGMDCIRCGAPDAYSCHYNGARAHSYGKGRGIKCHDLATADLCHRCDMEFSEGIMPTNCNTKWERSEEFLNLIMLTNIRRVRDGILKV